MQPDVTITRTDLARKAHAVVEDVLRTGEPLTVIDGHSGTRLVRIVPCEPAQLFASPA